jgi:DNA topoisomerase-1
MALSHPLVPLSSEGMVDVPPLAESMTGFTRSDEPRNQRLTAGLAGDLTPMTRDDSYLIAAEAGLAYVDQGEPGFRRVKRGRGFSYVTNDGRVVNGATKEWIESLVIPPAWEDVWISQERRGHILATGQDAAGRKQYIYHPLWEEMRDEVKFDRLAPFGRGLTRLRKRLHSDLRGNGLDRPKVVALAVTVLDRTLVRVGNRRYATDNESYGLTTLTCDHIEVDGRHVHLEFAGKGGAEHQLVFEDSRLSKLIAQCQELGGQTLFSYPGPDGTVGSVSSSDVNTYLSDALGAPFTAKDFRTWGASSLVLGELARSHGDDIDPDQRVRDAVDLAAERLGNTRAVCRDSYVHPLVIEAAESERLPELWRDSRAGRWLAREESALRKLLG